MKFILAISLMSAAAPAIAQTEGVPANGDRHEYAVVGSAPEVCQLSEPTLSGQTPALNIRTLTGRTITIDELADSGTLSTRATSVELSFDGFCNFPHEIVLESDNNGLFRQSAGNTIAPGFASAVPYSAELRWGSDTISLQADALTRRDVRQATVFADARTGSLLLRLQVLRGATNVTTAAPLLAGEYRDIIRITVGPQ